MIAPVGRSSSQTEPSTPQARSSQAIVSPKKRSTALGCVEVLGQLAALFGERRKQLAEQVGLTDQQWQALEEVEQTHFMPSLFAQRRDSSPAAVSKILRQLMDKGFITTEVSRQDGRQRTYSLTPMGQQTIGRLRAERERAIEEVWLRFDLDELTQFKLFGAALVERLEGVASKARRDESSKRAPDKPSI